MLLSWIMRVSTALILQRIECASQGRVTLQTCGSRHRASSYVSAIIQIDRISRQLCIPGLLVFDHWSLMTPSPDKSQAFSHKSDLYFLSRLSKSVCLSDAVFPEMPKTKGRRHGDFQDSTTCSRWNPRDGQRRRVRVLARQNKTF